jgi:HlyD family secretion protein
MKYTMRILAALATIGVSACDRGNNMIGGSGFIEATSVVVSAETAGRLEALYTDEGETIAAGAPLGIIDSTTIKLQIDRAQAQRQAAVTALDIARIAIEQADQDAVLAGKEYERIASLVKKGSANQQQYDQAENRYEQSRLARRQARATLAAREAEIEQIDAEIALLERGRENCYPFAPVGGTVIDKLVETGELLAPGRPIVEIARTDTVWVKVYLPAEHLTAIQIGQAASVDPEDGRTEPLEGRVVWISAEAEFTPKNVQTADARANLVYAVKVDVSNPDGVLKIGMPVMVRFDR